MYVDVFLKLSGPPHSVNEYLFLPLFVDKTQIYSEKVQQNLRICPKLIILLVLHTFTSKDFFYLQSVFCCALSSKSEFKIKNKDREEIIKDQELIFFNWCQTFRIYKSILKSKNQQIYHQTEIVEVEGETYKNIEGKDSEIHER